MGASVWVPGTPVTPVDDTVLRADLLAATGASLVGFKQTDWYQSLASSVAQTMMQKMRQFKNLLDFCSDAKRTTILAGTITDVTTELQAAVDAVCPLVDTGMFAGTVVLPDSCQLLLTATLDCTNSRVNGTLRRDGLRLAAGYGCIIIGSTGASKAIIETTGSQWLTIDRGIILDTTRATATKSTLGIYQGVCTGANSQTQNQHISCQIWLHTDPAANGGVGTVAVWNFGSEECTYDTIYWRADACCILTSSNDPANNPGGFQYSSYQALHSIGVGASHSLGVTTFTGECFMQGVGLHNAQLILQNISGLVIENLFIADTSTAGGANAYGVHLLGNVSASDLNLHLEVISSVLFTGSLITSRMRLIVGSVIAAYANQPALAFYHAGAATGVGQIINSDVIVDRQDLNGIAAPGAPILTTSDLNEVLSTSAAISGTQIIARALGSANLYVPQNMAANSSSFFLLGGNAGAVCDPTFTGYLAANTAAITGDGTIVDLQFAWNAGGYFVRGGRFDQTNGIFTVVMPGDYEFDVTVTLGAIAAGHTIAQLWIVNSAGGGQSYLLDQQNPSTTFVTIAAVNYYTLKGRIIIPMAYGDYVLCRISVGGAAKVVYAKAGTAADGYKTHFSGRSIRSR